MGLALSVRETPPLAASNLLRTDYDGDGLTDLQEEILGTDPDQRDTDLDGYSDLEERARGSDALDTNSIPVDSDFAVGLYASAESDILTLGSAVYARGDEFSNLGLGLGFVVDGEPVLLGRNVVGNATRSFQYPAAAPGEWIVVIELAVPERVVRNLGQLSFFAAAYKKNTDQAPSEATVALGLQTVVSFDGISMALEPAPAAILPSPDDDGGTSDLGVVYRPLSGEADIPSTWESGKVCWQATSPAGTNGSSVVLEITESDCLTLDSFCSPGDCAAQVGRTVEVPDPGALIGG